MMPNLLNDEELNFMSSQNGPSFGLWSIVLFDNLTFIRPNLLYFEQVEILFWLIKKLLDEGRIEFFVPQHLGKRIKSGELDITEYSQYLDWYIWRIPSEEQVKYFRCLWPKEGKHEHDLIVNNYFYDHLPAMIWVANDGSRHGS
jgi:hypothetical protein